MCQWTVFGYHNRSPLDKQSVLEEVSNFFEATKGKPVMVFTDGSVYDGAVSCGACLAVLVLLLDTTNVTIPKLSVKGLHLLCVN